MTHKIAISRKFTVHSVERWKIYSHWKNISSNQLFRNFFTKDTLLSRNFCQKTVRVKFCIFHTVQSYLHFISMGIEIATQNKRRTFLANSLTKIFHVFSSKHKLYQLQLSISYYFHGILSEKFREIISDLSISRKIIKLISGKNCQMIELFCLT